MRKAFVGLVILSALILTTGCETVNGTATGLYNVGKGLTDDTYNAYGALKKADRWLQENYW